MIGQTISHYKIEEKLGQGGMGVVYRAQDTRLRRMVALKMLLPELTADPVLRRRLEAEARVTCSLHHPAIATVYNFETEGDSAFIVYEYVAGKTLREAMQERSLDPPELLSITIQIADGLRAAHDADIVHQDLKPGNVMITEDGGVKILDFGLAKMPLALRKGMLAAGGQSTIPTESTPPGLLVGTVNYMSPEQLEGEKVDYRSDMFSFGVMLYEMASGRHPFEGKSPSSTIGNILKEEPPNLSPQASRAPAELERVIRKCLRKQRGERYQSTRDLVVDLETIRRDFTAPARAMDGSPEAEFTLPRRAARALFLITQVGYLVMYCAAVYNTEALEQVLERVLIVPAGIGMPFVIVSAMCGVAMRLYLLSSVGLDHPAAGTKFRRLFPAQFLLDSLWAASPLLLARKIGIGLAFVSVSALAYLPFAQRTLIQSIYRGGKSGDSGISHIPP